MQLLFWACVVFVFYAYFGYPAVLYVVARLFGKPVRRAAITPRVSFIIAARNEAARIRSKIENTLALDYPRDLMEIIVASDCSDDATHDIVREYAAQGVRLVAAPERRGKEFAQSLAIEASAGRGSRLLGRLHPPGAGRRPEHRAELCRPGCRLRQQRGPGGRRRRPAERRRGLRPVRDVPALARVARRVGRRPERVVLRGAAGGVRPVAGGPAERLQHPAEHGSEGACAAFRIPRRSGLMPISATRRPSTPERSGPSRGASGAWGGTCTC